MVFFEGMHPGAGDDKVYFHSKKFYAVKGTFTDQRDFSSIFRITAEIVTGMCWLIYGYIADTDSTTEEFYEVRGSLSEKTSARFKSMGRIFDSFAKVMPQKGFLRQTSHDIYILAGKIRQNFMKFFAIGGILHAKNINPLKIMSFLCGKHSTKYIANATLGKLSVARYGVTAKLRAKMSGIVSTTGTLLNDHGSWFVKVTGEYTPFTYLFSVPNRVQQFITDKEWFDNGDNE